MTLPIILASQSAIRAAVLKAAGVVVEKQSPGVDEDALKAGMAQASPAEVATALADEKALAVSRVRSGLVIGADQTLDFEGQLFDKARDLAQARERLLLMRGAKHRLHAGVTLARDGEVIWRTLSTSTLYMRSCSEAFVDGYLARNPQVLASVGCYELEGEGVQLFEKIEGDYFAILGLPLLGLLEVLRREGALAA